MPLPNTLRSDRRWLERIEGASVFNLKKTLEPRVRAARSSGATFPISLAILAVLLGAALAAYELYVRSLRWRADEPAPTIQGSAESEAEHPRQVWEGTGQLAAIPSAHSWSAERRTRRLQSHPQ
jgi:hypothetical protein